jgi:hypothetical protein
VDGTRRRHRPRLQNPRSSRWRASAPPLRLEAFSTPPSSTGGFRSPCSARQSPASRSCVHGKMMQLATPLVSSAYTLPGKQARQGANGC